jgi:heterotetrameric sarcosine oxidase delta subunit
MMQIACPWCGMRDEPEFIWGGTAHIAQPGLEASDQAWGEYLFFRDNPKGVLHERWRHAYGCGQWFNVSRNTVTHEILAVYGATERAP